MSSPIKRHRPSGGECEAERPSSAMDELRKALHRKVAKAVIELDQSPQWTTFKKGGRSTATKTRANLQARADLIARVATLMAFCTVLPTDTEVPFNVFLAGHLSRREIKADW